MSSCWSRSIDNWSSDCEDICVASVSVCMASTFVRMCVLDGSRQQWSFQQAGIIISGHTSPPSSIMIFIGAALGVCLHLMCQLPHAPVTVSSYFVSHCRDLIFIGRGNHRSASTQCRKVGVIIFILASFLTLNYKVVFSPTFRHSNRILNVVCILKITCFLF